MKEIIYIKVYSDNKLSLFNRGPVFNDTRRQKSLKFQLILNRISLSCIPENGYTVKWHAIRLVIL